MKPLDIFTDLFQVVQPHNGYKLLPDRSLRPKLQMDIEICAQTQEFFGNAFKTHLKNQQSF